VSECERESKMTFNTMQRGVVRGVRYAPRHMSVRRLRGYAGLDERRRDEGEMLLQSQARAGVVVMASAAVNTNVDDSVSSLKESGACYVASNRFAINPAAAPKFEARWATRKSRLAALDGFEFFTLMRLTNCDDTASELNAYNYVSFTIWSEKKHFNSWRTGEAFKEAHGGGTIFGFVDMLVNSIGVIKGPPKPIFFNGSETSRRDASLVPEGRRVEGGWRVVEANGVDKLDAEVYASVIAFDLDDAVGSVPNWKDNGAEEKNSEEVASVLMRRDTKVKMHGAEDPKNIPKGKTGYAAAGFFESEAARDAWAANVAAKVRGAEGITGVAAGAYEGVLVLEA